MVGLAFILKIMNILEAVSEQAIVWLLDPAQDILEAIGPGDLGEKLTNGD